MKELNQLDMPEIEHANITHNALPTFKTILIATDFSASSSIAFAVAERMATSLHVRLLILHVFENADTILESAGGIACGLEALLNLDQTKLEHLRQRAKKADVEVEAIMEYGIASDTILNVIAARNVDLAIVGTKGAHGLDRGLFGSTAEAVLRKACCPVITVGPHVRERIGQQNISPVMFSTDFRAVSKQVVRYAISLCQQIGAPLHCVDVLPQSLAESKKTNTIPLILTDALRQMVSQTGAGVDHPVYKLIYGSGVPAAIVNYAKQVDAQFIVLGVKRGPGVISHLPAHIAYSIIAESPCPVLTLCSK